MTRSLNPSLTFEKGLSLQIAGETIEFLPEKALYWKNKSILAFSDVHLGKAESYQAAGIPMPSGAHIEDLNAITLLIQKHQPKQVLILGDWIHQRTSWTEQIKSDLQEFFDLHKFIQWSLILGNHESGSIQILKNFPIEIHQEDLNIAPFTFTHGHTPSQQKSPPVGTIATQPPTTQTSQSKRFFIQGHIHPVVRLKEGSTNLRLPAFILRKQTLILPAFGSQTGGHELKLQRADQAFATTGSMIFEINKSKLKDR